MKKAGTKKQETRERILRAAARAIRRRGYEGVGVAEVMKDAGLTHGGFYAHFASRDALLAAAADRAGADSMESLSRAIAGAPRGEELAALADYYLANRHIQDMEVGLGCFIAAAGSDVPRQDVEVRRVVGRRVKEVISLIERQLPGWGKQAAHERALVITVKLVGALILARAVDDPQLSRAIRKAALEAISATTA